MKTKLHELKDGQSRLAKAKIKDDDAITDRYIELLETMPIVDALWWFTENIGVRNKSSTNIYFYLRERYRSEVASAAVED